MIEDIVMKHLKQYFDGFVYMEHPKVNQSAFIVMERISGHEENHLCSSTFTFQSYGYSLYYAATTNESLKRVMKELNKRPEIARVKLDSDYNFTNEETKEYRYQAVYEINYYDYYQ